MHYAGLDAWILVAIAKKLCEFAEEQEKEINIKSIDNSEACDVVMS